MTLPTVEDLRWLDAAVRHAAPYLGTTGENPSAGALVVDPYTQTVIARAATAPGGRPHAEALAIEAAGFAAAGCTLYVTQEPCHHWGRSPPCVDAVVRSGVMRVVIGALNPDSLLAGKGVERLESSGVEVVVAHHAESIALHAGHRTNTREARPFVTATMMISADGMVRDRVSDRTLPRSTDILRVLDALRSRADASLVTSDTARGDDPQLVVEASGMQTRTPLRVVLTDADGVDRQVNLVGSFSGYRTAVIAETDTKVDAPGSVEIIRVAGSNGSPDLSGALAALSAKGIQNLLVEPDGRLAADMLEAGLIDCFALVVSPEAMGDKGQPAHPDRSIEEMLAAAGLVAASVCPLGGDSMTLYGRPA